VKLNRTQELPNYFIRQRNDFLSIPRARLHAVQKRLFAFRENPFGHLVAALRRFHFPGAALSLDLGRLLNLINVRYAVELINPGLTRFMNAEPNPEDQPARKKTSDDSDGFWADVRKYEVHPIL